MANNFEPYVDMNKREFGALSCSDAAPSFFIPADAPVKPDAPLGYTALPGADATTIKYNSLEARYGRASTIATPDEIKWAQHYDPITNTWDTDDPEIVPPEFKTQVADYIVSVDAYAEVYRVWQLDYFTAATAQWRLYISDAILAISQP